MSDPENTPLLHRILAGGGSALANDCIADHVSPDDLSRMESEVGDACLALLHALAIDTTGDHNTAGTAQRMAKMFVREVFAGRYRPAPDVTDFPNVKNLDEVVVVGPVTVRSTCAHHFCPIQGEAICGIIPNGRVIGLSKFARLTDWVMSRPQIQEEATIQLADALQAAIDPRALGVIVTASHACMTWRGVREGASKATTSVMRGLFRENAAARAEFMQLTERHR